MAKSGFVGVLKDTALKLCVRGGYEPTTQSSELCFHLCQSTVRILVQNRTL